MEFSADVYAFATASEKSVEGDLVAAFPKGEGEGFAGFAILALAGVAVIWGIGQARATARTASPPVPWRTIAGRVLASRLRSISSFRWLMLAGSLPIA
jgi:hypothetical protein